MTQRSPAAARSNFLVTCDRARGREGRRSKGRPGGGRLAQRERRGVRVTGEFEASRIPGSHVLGAQSIGENVPPHRPGRTLCLTLLLSRQQSCLCLAFDFSLPPSHPPSDVFCVFLSSFSSFLLLCTSLVAFPPLSLSPLFRSNFFFFNFFPYLAIFFFFFSFFCFSFNLFPLFLLCHSFVISSPSSRISCFFG